MQGVTAALWHAAATLAAPGLRRMLRRRVARGKEIASRLPEREGIDPAPRPPGRLIWLHAASVGESISVLPVLSALAGAAPDVTLLVTTGTVTSAELLEQRLPPRALHRFVPLDMPKWAARFLDHWRPDAAAFVESELWPNLLAACRARKIPLMLINARLSARSAHRWGMAPSFARQMLGAFDRVHAQSPADGRRLVGLGARNVHALGDLKLSAPPLPVDDAELRRLRGIIGDRPVWLAASTHPGEEAVAGEVHAALAVRHPGLLTIVAPRHPARGPAVAAILGGAGRRAEGGEPTGGIWVVDTMGELGLLYRLAQVVFVGRSLVGQGGQNPWEPARLGCALAVGPSTANFTAAVRRLQDAGALTVVTDAGRLTAWVDEMLRDPERRDAAGRAAEAVASGPANLPERTAQVLLGLMR